ncbi:hypothetical protein JL100_034975 (plasmid) [Skermanella mucosa]|uniref:hypothetical protein n=1 Tax=Skermanella mucosa TaxID=1789672 RepID=UPI00192B263E|nr:hypothetical protein [Skermanella mucosa]UEM25266.1 hypothetical protein JL100_034975 [Skermanella mucosa]
MRMMIAATALAFAVSAAAPALAGEGGCSWSQSVKAPTSSTTQTAQTTPATTPATTQNGG